MIQLFQTEPEPTFLDLQPEHIDYVKELNLFKIFSYHNDYSARIEQLLGKSSFIKYSVG